MRRAGRLLPLAAALLGASPAAAHEEAQLWPTLTVTAPIIRGVFGSAEIVDRTVADTRRAAQLAMRFQLGHPVTRRLTVWAGYAHVATYNPGRREGIDNRVVEQVNWAAGTIGPVRVASRTRFEQRFVRGVGAVSWRLREQVRLTLPLAARGPSLAVWAEPTIALNRTAAQRTTLDQLRAFAGVDLPVGRHAEVEVGYLNQHLHRLTGDVGNDVIPLVLNLRF